jgi:predicted nuclease of predicted toxin-antitoxin system
MIIWIDAQLSPHLAPWITSTFGVEAYSAKWLGLESATDKAIFLAAKNANAMTKDSDFLTLLDQLGHPPKVIWITIGNTSTQNLKDSLILLFPKALSLLEAGECLVEITD